MPLLVFLIFLFVFPWVALVFLLLFAMLIPMGFTSNSFLKMLTSPSHIIRILFNPRVRRNHAVEHGTINVLEEEYGDLDVEGTADEEGFSIKSVIPPETVLFAAKTALARMKSGEGKLAVLEKCGMTVAAVNSLSAVLFLLILFISGAFSLLSALAAVFFAHVASRFLSPFIQRNMTTPDDILGLEVLGVEMRNEKIGFAGIEFLIPSSVFVRTGIKGEALVAEVVSE
ncbi:MAG: DUF6391 domain-containing protein [Aminobacteriaceae bacterium]|jgi:hypothetical protein|uniref:DUF6391 domain-containing protein n=2 Tax=Aminivibrio sp. TaxID=1872489 RepID=UPI00345EF098